MSLSEPHIDKFAVNSPYLAIFLSVVRCAVNRLGCRRERERAYCAAKTAEEKEQRLRQQ